MINAFFIKILYNVGVLELSAIVTSHSLDLHIKFILGSCGKLLENFMNFALVLHKVYQE
jgi:hypothetical protein